MDIRKGSLAALVCAAIGTLAFASQAGAAVLWDQNNTPSAFGFFSQQDVPPTDPAPSELADDFFVPVTSTYEIRGVDVTGQYIGSGQASSVNVRFYQDSGTVPGALITERDDVVPAAGIDTGNFSIPISPEVDLNTGNYWISVQANGLDYISQIWDWENRPLQGSTDPAAARTASVTGCVGPGWAARTACGDDSGNPDQMFSLSDVTPVGPNPPGGGTTTAPGNPTSPINPAGHLRKRKCKKKHKSSASVAKKKKCKKKKRH